MTHGSWARSRLHASRPERSTVWLIPRTLTLRCSRLPLTAKSLPISRCAEPPPVGARSDPASGSARRRRRDAAIDICQRQFNIRARERDSSLSTGLGIPPGAIVISEVTQHAHFVAVHDDVRLETFDAPVGDQLLAQINGLRTGRKGPRPQRIGDVLYMGSVSVGSQKTCTSR